MTAKADRKAPIQPRAAAGRSVDLIGPSDGMLTLDDLADLRKSVEKDLGARIYFGNDERLKLRKLTLGIAPIDRVLAGGFAFDRMSLIIGEFSAGKTLLALFALKAAIELGVSCAYIDGEKTWTPEWSESLGVDTSKVLVVRPRSGEDAFNTALTLVKRRVGVLIIDSLASLRPKTEIEGDEKEIFDRQHVAVHARLINRGIEDLEQVNDGTLIIAINQLRSGVNAYGNPETLPGGKAQGFYAWQLIRVRRTAFIEEGVGAKKKKIGYKLLIRVEKSKQSEPYREVEVSYYYTGQIDELMGIIEMCIEAGVIRQEGTYYFIDDVVDEATGELSQLKIWGRPRLLEALKASEALQELIVKRVESMPSIEI